MEKLFSSGHRIVEFPDSTSQLAPNTREMVGIYTQET